MKAVTPEIRDNQRAGLRAHMILCSDEERWITTAVAIGKKKRRNRK
ncbi:hypothetical protein RKLH11_3 [Rhodobacteraceae bacterium KLH11]|nr:hypothetical protein RKLH11_3 [Rhodobacteraceae bacterium KLH11]